MDVSKEAFYEYAWQLPERYRDKEIKKWKEIEEYHSQVLDGDDTDVYPEAQKYLMYSDGDFTRVKWHLSTFIRKPVQVFNIILM